MRGVRAPSKTGPRVHLEGDPSDRPRTRMATAIRAYRAARHDGFGLRTPAPAAVGVPLPASIVAAMDRLEYFARLAAESPSEPRARYGYANELYKAGRYEDAVREWRAYLDLAEDEGSAWGKLAESLAALGQVDEAADAYLAGIEQAAKHGHAGMAEDLQTAMEEL